MGDRDVERPHARGENIVRTSTGRLLTFQALQASFRYPGLVVSLGSSAPSSISSYLFKFVVTVVDLLVYLSSWHNALLVLLVIDFGRRSFLCSWA